MTGAVAPAWLLRPEPGLCSCGCSGKRRRGWFVQHTLDGAATLVRRAMFADDVAAEPGFLQRLEPRVKLVTLLGLLLVAALVHTIPVLVAMYVATLGLAAASRIGVGFFVRRVWLFIPIFTGIVVLPAALNVVRAGTIVVPLGTYFGHRVGLTSEGLTAAGLIVSRVAVSISLVVLLTLTNAVSEMYLARKARTVGHAGGRSARRFVAASAGALFGKAHAMAEDVHMAMVARGYTGDVRNLAPERFVGRDVCWSLVCCAFALLLLGGDRVVSG